MRVCMYNESLNALLNIPLWTFLIERIAHNVIKIKCLRYKTLEYFNFRKDIQDKKIYPVHRVIIRYTIFFN